MGIAIDHNVDFENTGFTINATWASTGGNKIQMSKYSTGTTEGGEPIYKYTISCDFEYWVDEAARNNGKSSLTSRKVYIEYDQVPTGNLYELLYAKFNGST